MITSWAINANGYLEFSLGDITLTVQLLVDNPAAIGLWDHNSGDSQVWLPTRPTFE
ncbi:hypothetical protein [Paraferrimonas sp. SM1919]|uniref:hypothetical protein n=1 Tax=Paraferrimonas sp. SM1919 TaxID=2662263 RepID=UPI0013CFE27C|nr:hypothetical protein [Paraferrimonas sp. SM1919]